MAISSKAAAAEIAAFKKVKKVLKDATTFAEPAGFETSFPDFGFRLKIGGKKVDVHIEYKADAKAQMGSMRDWVYDGNSNQFYTPKADSSEKQMLIDLMNGNADAKRNAKRLLKDLNTYVDPGLKLLYSGSLTVVKDKQDRREKLEAFAKHTDNYQIAKIKDASLGNGIIDHYKKKFKAVRKPDADASVLLMMIGDKIWMVDKTPTFNAAIENEVAKMFGGTKIPKIGQLSAALEVRIQPRGLSAPGKPVSIDVMASFRLDAALTGGVSV